MNSDSALFLAILAMDAYNRRGDTVTNRNLAVEGTRLGNVEVSDRLGDSASGFFAVSYTDLNTQQKIISYRGTDTATPFEFGKDVLNGWTVGMGYYSPTQAARSAEFFQRVAGGSTLNDLYNANIVLTGHSLGGGLAGLMASIYCQSGIKIFDSMDFTGAALYLRDSTNGTGSTDEAAKSLFFRGSSPASLSVFEQINYSVQGQGLSSLTGLPGASWGGAPGAINRQEYQLGFDDLLGPVDRHSSALAVLMTYAYETGISSDWTRAGRYFIPKLFDNSLAEVVGAVSGGTTGDWSAYNKILARISRKSPAPTAEIPRFGETFSGDKFRSHWTVGRAAGPSSRSRART